MLSVAPAPDAEYLRGRERKDKPRSEPGELLHLALEGLQVLAARRGAVRPHRGQQVVRRDPSAPPGRQLALERALGGEAAGLTARQREIVVLIAQGLTNREIAEKLVLTTGTVANHIENILNKLKFRRRTEIATWAVERGLLARAREAEG